MCVGQRHRGTKRRYSVECRGNPPPVSPGFLLNDVEFRLFPALATSHVTRHASHVTRHTYTRHTSRVTRHASHVTRHASHVTRHASHIARHTSSRTHPRGGCLGSPELRAALRPCRAGGIGRARTGPGTRGQIHSSVFFAVLRQQLAAQMAR